ncbi:hypothetical protein [Chitinophaga rhizosphaerae]|nr:hypothetical protein [Chitinophaga rhizosphaerae]
MVTQLVFSGVPRYLVLDEKSNVLIDTQNSRLLIEKIERML